MQGREGLRRGSSRVEGRSEVGRIWRHDWADQTAGDGSPPIVGTLR